MAAMVVRPVRQKLLTVEEWAHRADGEEYELIDGLLRARMVNQNYHEFAVGRLAFVITGHLLESKAVGRLFTSNTKYRVRARRGIMPDVSVILGEKVSRIVPDAAYNTQGPDLAVEVLSTDQGPDYIEERFDDYWKLSTTEVWIVDPRAQVVTGHTRGTGEFEQFAVASGDEEFRSRLLECLTFSVGLHWMASP
jgi:Uma2 family endonuclease